MSTISRDFQIRVDRNLRGIRWHFDQPSKQWTINQLTNRPIDDRRIDLPDPMLERCKPLDKVYVIFGRPFGSTSQILRMSVCLSVCPYIQNLTARAKRSPENDVNSVEWFTPFQHWIRKINSSILNWSVGQLVDCPLVAWLVKIRADSS
jgi:hypothetical protein